MKDGNGLKLGLLLVRKFSRPRGHGVPRSGTSEAENITTGGTLGRREWFRTGANPAETKSQSAFTLMELLITMGVIAIIAPSVYFLTIAAMRLVTAEEIHTVLRQEASRVLTRIVDDVSAARQATQVVGSREIQVWIDSNNNGIQDVNERVAYRSNAPTSRDLTRYLDATGQILSQRLSALTFTPDSLTTSEVRSIAVSLTLSQGTDSFRLSSRAKLRNYR